jgi:hypothetical protein
MKKLTRDRVVPTISARVSWLILGITVSGTPSFPKMSQQKQNPSEPFFAGIKKVIDQVLFVTNVPPQHIRYKLIREGVFAVKGKHHCLLVNL